MTFSFSRSLVLVAAVVCALVVRSSDVAAEALHAQSEDAVHIMLGSDGACEPAWIPTFFSTFLSNNTVEALVVFDDGSGAGPSLYVGGSFAVAGGVTVNGIARWDGVEWSALGEGVSGGNSPRVEALHVFDDGDGAALYVGGTFTSAGGVAASNIARWDGAAWSTVGDGVDGTVRSMTVFDDGSGAGPALYVGGSFLIAGDESVGRIARWDGALWSGLNGGVDGAIVNALRVFDDGSGPALYAGILRQSVDNVPTAGWVGRWDGATWSLIGDGANISVMQVFDDGDSPTLYVGGTFHMIDNIEINGIAKWDGVSWAPLGDTDVLNVRSMAVYDDGDGPSLYIGGRFSSIGGVIMNGVASWDGADWSPLGSGLDPSLGRTVFAMTTFDGPDGPALHVGGDFYQAGDSIAHNIAAWNGAKWSALESGTEDGTFYEFRPWQVNAIADFDDGSGPTLYAGGVPHTVGGASVARWDGDSWISLSMEMSGATRNVHALEVFDDGAGPALYVGGGFSTIDGEVVNGIAKWDGDKWSALGDGVTSSGLTGRVLSMTVFDDGSGGGPALYVAGEFSQSGGVSATNIAKWDGENWSSLGSGLPGSGRDMVVYDDGSGEGPALYVVIASSQGSLRHVARWNGSEWSSLGANLTESGAVFASVGSITVFNDGSGPTLYIGGRFQLFGSFLTVFHTARWNGESWSPLSADVDGFVRTLAVYDDGNRPALYAGGTFANAGGAPASNIARWSGSEWTALGVGASDSVHALQVFDDGSELPPALYVGGFFTRAGSHLERKIARWQGCPPCPADLIGNGSVDAGDLSILIGSWGEPHGIADIDGDGVVGASDLAILLGSWGPCP